MVHLLIFKRYSWALTCEKKRKKLSTVNSISLAVEYTVTKPSNAGVHLSFKMANGQDSSAIGGGGLRCEICLYNIYTDWMQINEKRKGGSNMLWKAICWYALSLLAPLEQRVNANLTSRMTPPLHTGHKGSLNCMMSMKMM